MVCVLACFGCASRAAVQTKEDDVDLEPHQQQTYQHSYDPVKPASDKGQQQGGNRQAMLYVRMASMSSSGGADSTGGGSTGGASDVSEPAAAAEDVWFEAEEQADWLAGAAPELDSISEAPTGSQSSAQTCLTAEQLAALAVLPAQLQKLLTKYLQGSVGCKPLVALMRYMQDSSTSLSVLHDMLQPLLDAEQHLPPQMPFPSPQMTPAVRSALLRSQLQQAHHPASSGTQQQQQQSSQPRITHLLRTLGLAVRTLHIMDQEEGFKQVASGPLTLWYRHDTVAKSQMIRARVVLDESVVTITAIAREFDLVTSWNPGMSDLRELASYSATEMLIYLLPWMPWPLPLPQMINFVFAADLLDLQPRCVLLHTSSAEAPPGVEVPKHSRTMPMHMDVGGFRLSPLPPSADKPNTPRTEVTVLVSIDAARLVVPDTVISCVLKVFAPLVHKSVLKVFARMFHTAATASASAPSAAGDPRCSSPTTCSTSLLVERLGLRPEYAVLDAHAARVLAAEAAQAAAGPARPLEFGHSPGGVTV